MASERLADEGERANVEAVVHAAIGLGHGVTQPAARSQSAHEVAAGAVDVLLVMTIPKLRLAPAFEMPGEPPVPLIQERPVQKGTIRVRKHVVRGKGASVSVDPGGRRVI